MIRTYARKTHNLLILFKNIKIGQFKQLVVFKWFFIEICVSPKILNSPSTPLRGHFSLAERWSLSEAEVSRSQKNQQEP